MLYCRSECTEEFYNYCPMNIPIAIQIWNSDKLLKDMYILPVVHFLTTHVIPKKITCSNIFDFHVWTVICYHHSLISFACNKSIQSNVCVVVYINIYFIVNVYYTICACQ